MEIIKWEKENAVNLFYSINYHYVVSCWSVFSSQFALKCYPRFCTFNNTLVLLCSHIEMTLISGTFWLYKLYLGILIRNSPGYRQCMSTIIRQENSFPPFFGNFKKHKGHTVTHIPTAKSDDALRRYQILKNHKSKTAQFFLILKLMTIIYISFL